jgi:hypothetical protein
MPEEPETHFARNFVCWHDARFIHAPAVSRLPFASSLVAQDPSEKPGHLLHVASCRQRSGFLT